MHANRAAIATSSCADGAAVLPAAKVRTMTIDRVNMLHLKRNELTRGNRAWLRPVANGAKLRYSVRHLQDIR